MKSLSSVFSYAALFVRPIKARYPNPMLEKYNRIIGPMTKDMLTGSTVGVIAAARMAITRTAILQCFSRVLGWTIPIKVNTYTTKGNSKVTPIQNKIPVTKLI